jgi:hypothetical protein
MNLEIFGILSRPFDPQFVEKDLTAASVQLASQAYQRLIARLDDVVARGIVSSERHIDLLRAIGRSLAIHLDESIKPGRVEQPLIPMITEEGTSLWISDLERRFLEWNGPLRSIFAMSALAGFCYETRALWTLDPELRDTYTTTISLDLTTAMESYGFWKAVQRRDIEGFDMFGTRQAVEHFIAEQTKRIDQSLLRHGSNAVEMQDLVIKTSEDATKIFAEAKTTVADATAAVQKVKQETLENQERLEGIVKAIDATEGQVNAFAASVREELKIDTTKILWKDRAFWSATSFWISAVVVAFAILAPPLWALTHIEAVLAVLKRVGDAATQGLPSDATAAQLTAATISRLVVISAPLGLYFWAIKLLVRFSTRSMVLMDDARQRHTTMDTYFHLIERSGATTEERGLMLNALFRPLPGQGQENVEPPNFMELVKRPE